MAVARGTPRAVVGRSRVNLVCAIARLRAILLLLLLVPLQITAPLLHAHALEDSSRFLARGIHVPGLESLDHDDESGPVLRERSFPLIEEADLSRRDTTLGDLPPPVEATVARPSPQRAPWRPDGTVSEPARFGSLPPPPRAPPLRPLV
jgi:hypothetical protein